LFSIGSGTGRAIFKSPNIALFVTRNLEFQNMKNIIFFLFMTLSVYLHAQSTKKEILLIGTFHFNNPGADIAQVKNFDIMNKKSQNELEVIANKISTYKPDKIFVEWEYNKQARLDTLYNLYIDNKYFNYIEERYPRNSFYQQNEMFN